MHARGSSSSDRNISGTNIAIYGCIRKFRCAPRCTTYLIAAVVNMSRSPYYLYKRNQVPFVDRNITQNMSSRRFTVVLGKKQQVQWSNRILCSLLLHMTRALQTEQNRQIACMHNCIVNDVIHAML